MEALHLILKLSNFNGPKPGIYDYPVMADMGNE